MSMNQEDIDREIELEKLLSSLYPEDTPFSFSKTICKALEIAYESLTTPQPTPQEAKKPDETNFRQSVPGKTRPSKIFGKRKH